MGLRKTTLLFFIYSLMALEVNASWLGPKELIKNTWGTSSGQFGLQEGDTSDLFPNLEAVLPDFKIVISDFVNEKQMVFDKSGTLIKESSWVAVKDSSGDEYFEIPEYSYGVVIGFAENGNLFTQSVNKYYLTTITGKTLQTYTERPLELGRIKDQSYVTGEHKTTVTYPDKEWVIIGDGLDKQFIRDVNGNLYGIIGKLIERYGDCGGVVGSLKMPDNNVEEIDHGPGVEPQIIYHEQYGNPVLAPNGDVYTWKRTPINYSIIKWTWQDDPNGTVSSVNPPRNVKTKPASNGIAVTWWHSFQDPPYVTGYELERGSSENGPFNKLSDISKGIENYTDTTAQSGTTYYYRLRAMSPECGDSDYSNIVSGTK